MPLDFSVDFKVCGSGKKTGKRCQFFRKGIIINTTTTLLSFQMSRPGNNFLYLEHAIIDT